VRIDAALVRRLIVAQFPRWAELPVRPVEAGGRDNRTLRIGSRMTARLPSAEQYTLQVEKGHRWLPKLAPLLSLPIPVPWRRAPRPKVTPGSDPSTGRSKASPRASGASPICAGSRQIWPSS
jgi:hypothetical protein